MILIISFAVILVLFIMWFISTYNQFVELRNNIDKSWSNINVLLKQRFDEIPNLVETVKGYMKHERGTLKEVTQARTSWKKAKTIGEKAEAAGKLSSALTSLFAVAESYPKLQANDNFKHLQNRISTLEDEIAEKREYYNDNVNTFNVNKQQFPASIIAGFMNLDDKKLFQVPEAETKPVKVKF